MSPRMRALIVIGLALVGSAVSGLLLMQHHGESGAVSVVEQACGEGQASGCDTVNRSAYATVAGIPLAAIGLTFYLSLALLLGLALFASEDGLRVASFLGLLGLAIALVVDVVLLGLQAFAIHAFCKLCLLTYALGLIAFGLLAWARLARTSVGAALATGEGRQLAAGWVLGTLAAAAAVGAGNFALVARAETRQAGLLGTPVGSAAPEPARASETPPSPATSAAAPATTNASASASTDRTLPEDLKSAQAEIKRLRETLDDPQKLDRYFADKAAKEFERAQVQTVDLKDVPFKGPGNAPVKVVEYSDFLCPFCQNLAGAFGQYLQQSGNRVVIHFKNHPLDKECNPTLQHTVHPGACNLALGAVCAQEQGHFWPYHDKVFFGSKLNNPQVADVVKVGGEAGLDPAALQACLASPRAREKLAREIAEGHKVGVTATPTVLLSGKKLPRINDFIQMVDKEAARLGLPPTPPPSPQPTPQH